MSHSLAAGEPSLDQGEIFPAVIVDIPAHMRGYLIGILLSPFQDRNDLFGSYLVMLLQFVDPPPVMGKRLAMPRQDEGDVILIDLVQAVEVRL